MYAGTTLDSLIYARRADADRESGARRDLPLDLALQLNHAIEQRFGRGRTAGHIDIDRHDAIAATHYRIGVMVIAAAVGAGAHRDDPARLGHLVIDLAQRGRHLVDQGPGHDHDVGFT